MPPMIDRQVTLSDGRTLWYGEYGDPDGIPFMVMHGTPGSRKAGRLFDQAGHESGLRIISPERPGCGLSSVRTDAPVVDYADDVVALAGALGLDRFGVMGISGGAPYALACAYKIPDRLRVTGMVSGIGPLSLPGSLAGMMAGNRIVFSLARFAPGVTGSFLAVMNRSMMGSMRKQIEAGKSPVPGLPPEIFAALIEDQIEALAHGGKGLPLELRNLWRSWGFELEDIQAEVYLWHGEKDGNAPPGLAHQMAQRIPGCQATFYPDDDHIGVWIKHSAEIIGTLAEAARRNQ